MNKIINTLKNDVVIGLIFVSSWIRWLVRIELNSLNTHKMIGEWIYFNKAWTVLLSDVTLITEMKLLINIFFENNNILSMIGYN